MACFLEINNTLQQFSFGISVILSDRESETDTDLDELLEDLDELQWLLSQGIKEIQALQEIEACKRTAECAAFFCVYVCIVIYIIYTISSSIE